jgi:2-C-methyl-D-erythritol 4-phosphate cytidylyltransferase
MMQPKIIVIIPCAGRGSRFESDIPKQYHKIGSQTVLEHTLNKFINLEIIKAIYIVSQIDDKYCNNYANLSSKISILQVESDSRAMSVKKALAQIQLDDQDWVLVHDAVRCCISQQAIIRLITQLYDDAVGGILAIPVTDTLKTTDNKQQIITTLDRSLIYLAQTPQMFRYAILKQSLLNCDLNKITDESSSVELLGHTSKIILGEVSNIKITTPGDLEIAQFFLEHKNCN